MEAQIVFKVKLRAHGEVSPAFIQRLKIVRTHIDQLFGPANATVRDEADVSYEQIHTNGIDRTEGWDLTCHQPAFVGGLEFSYSKPDDFSADCSEVSTLPCHGDPSVGLSPGLTIERHFDAFPPLHTPSSNFSGQSAQSSLTHGCDHDDATGGDSMAERGNKSAGRSETKRKAYNPDASDAGSAQDAKGPKRRKK